MNKFKSFCVIYLLSTWNDASSCTDEARDLCVSSKCSGLEPSLVFSSSGSSNNRLYLNMTSYNGAVTACATRVFGADYYWRNFHGQIPEDAVPAGQDSDGRTTFIGSATYPTWKDAVLPSVIYQTEKFAFAHMGDVETKSDRNVKILCAPLNNQPKWHSVTLDEINTLKGCNFIKEGLFEDIQFFYIGRAHRNDRYIPGKVIPKGHKWNGMELWDGGKRYYTKFQILGYCC